MPIARFQMPDGRVARFEVPEGTSPEQAQSLIEKELAGLGERIATAPPTIAERILGHPVTRFALGAASPVLGAIQLGAEALGSPVVTEHLASLEEMKRKGMSAPDPVTRFAMSAPTIAALPWRVAQELGIDLPGLAGTILSPAVLGAMKIPAAASAIGRMGQGAAIGTGFGAVTPVTSGEDFAGTKTAQTGAGAILGGVIPPAIDVARTGVRVARNILDPLFPGGVERGAARILAEAAGPKRAAIETELAKPQVLVPGSQPTAAEAAARAGSPEFSALQQIAREHKPSAYSDIAKAQEAARLASIQTIGKDKAALKAAEQTRAEAAKESYGAIRNLKIDPRSDVEIMEDAIAQARGRPFAIAGRADFTGKTGALREWGKFATSEAENIARGERFTPVPGMPRVSARVSDFPERAKEAQIAAQEAIEIAKRKFGEEKFLQNTLDLLRQTVGMEEKNLQVFLRRPSVREAIKDAMQSALETGSYFPTKIGDKFSIGNLQRIKESLDAGIAAAKAATNVGKRPELSPQELEGTRSAFVAWLSKKSPEWQAARHEYLLNSRLINEMQVGQELERALVKPIGEGERASVFAGAMREAPRTIKKATGQPRFEELEEVLQPQNLGKVKAVLADLARKAEFERLAPLGRAKTTELVGSATLPAIGAWHQQYNVMRAVLKRVTTGITGKTLDTMADALQLPSSTLKLLQKTATPQQDAMIDLIIKQKLGRGAIAAGAELSGEGMQQQ